MIMPKSSGLKNAPSQTGKVSGGGRANNTPKQGAIKGGNSRSGKK